MATNILIFPVKEPDEVLDYQIDATTKIAEAADTIEGVAVSIAPSGPNEMVARQVQVNGSFITIWLAGGIAARIYQVKVRVSTSGSRTYEWTIPIQINADLAVYPITPPTSAGFGVSIMWAL